MENQIMRTLALSTFGCLTIFLTTTFEALAMTRGGGGGGGGIDGGGGGGYSRKGFKPSQEPPPRKDSWEPEPETGSLQYDSHRGMYHYGDPLPMGRDPNPTPPTRQDESGVYFDLSGGTDENTGKGDGDDQSNQGGK